MTVTLLFKNEVFEKGGESGRDKTVLPRDRGQPSNRGLKSNFLLRPLAALTARTMRGQAWASLHCLPSLCLLAFGEVHIMELAGQIIAT